MAEARKKFEDLAVKEKHISKEEAKRISEKLIGATWDLGHMNMLRKAGYEGEELKQKIICGEKIEKKFIAEQTIDNLSPNFPTNHTDEASKIIFQYFYNNTKIDPRKMNAVLNFLLNRIDLFKRLSNHSPPQLSKIIIHSLPNPENFKKDVASFFKLLFLPDFVFAASSPLLDSNEPPLQDSIFSYS